MAPERSPKRQKTSADTETPSAATRPSQIPLPPDTPKHHSADTTIPSSQQSQRSSFFSSWSKKAPPLAQAAQEGIKSASIVASEVANEVASSIKDVQLRPRSIRSPSLAMTLGKGKSSRASLADATTTMVHAEANSPARRSSRSAHKDHDDLAVTKTVPTKGVVSKDKEQLVPKADKQSLSNAENTPAAQDQAPNQRSSWLGWLGRGDTGSEGSAINVAGAEAEAESKQVLSTSAKPTSESAQSPQSAPVTNITQKVTGDQQEQHTNAAPVNREGTEQEAQASKRGWLPLWSTTTTATPENTQADSGSTNIQNVQSSKLTEVQKPTETVVDSKVEQAQPSAPSETASPPALPHDANKASAWAFWSRDRKANSSASSIDKPRDGEIAISDTSSQNKPKKASFSVPNTKEERQPEPPKPTNKQDDSVGRLLADKATEAEISKTSETASTKIHSKQNSKSGETMKAESSNATATSVEPSVNKKPAPTKSTHVTHNLLLPTLHATLKLPESPSLLLRLANMLYAAREPELRHLTLVKDPPKIANALAIGVHGYFPAPLLRSVLGQPTGTSIKFADMAAKSIKQWTLAHGYECQVKTAALEGEGKIAERLELLWRLLLNWIEEIRKSDFILIACHSQGVPVAIMLVAKLIQFGCVSSAKVGICAMAGVNMGPFPEYKSRWIGGSAGELFEFSDPSSRVSADYVAALEVVLKFGVRLTFIGSIDDQLVSLESSIYSPISHPHIFRAVSIDSRVHAPNFLSHLVGFALKLRNLGVQDHGLIRELSSPLAGSLYTGEGHSRIYEDDAVYDLAVSFTLETSSLPGVHISQRPVVSGGSNPYILPFAMRGILEEDFVKNELQSEASDLLKEFDDWKPTTKALKDVKFRLEGIRSKL